MTSHLTTLRTMTQYSLARLRVLCTTRRFWPAVLVSSLVVLAVIGTSAAWRARTSAEESPVAEAAFSVSPLTELMPQRTAVPTPHESTTPTNTPPVTLATATDTSTITPSAEARDPMTTTTNSGERAQPACHQQVNTMPHAVEMPERDRTRVQRATASARVERERALNTHPSRPATRALVPALPRVQVVSVSSTAVLIQHDGQRQVVRRGARLNGWTLARLAPTGVTLRRAQQYAVVPLSFGSRFSSNR